MLKSFHIRQWKSWLLAFSILLSVVGISTSPSYSLKGQHAGVQTEMGFRPWLTGRKAHTYYGFRAFLRDHTPLPLKAHMDLEFFYSRLYSVLKKRNQQIVQAFDPFQLLLIEPLQSLGSEPPLS